MGEVLTQFAKDTLASGKVIPGFGHGASARRPVVQACQRVLRSHPARAQGHGQGEEPLAQRRCSSGTLMAHYGLTQEDYYTVVFSVSRALGCTSNLVWSRMMGLPIERPKSVTIDWLLKKVPQ